MQCAVLASSWLELRDRRSREIRGGWFKLARVARNIIRLKCKEPSLARDGSMRIKLCSPRSKRWDGRNGRSRCVRCPIGRPGRRFPRNFASRAGIAEGRSSHAPLHEVSPSGVATGNGMQGRARSTACGRRISTGRMRPSLQSGQRSGGLGCSCLVTAASRTLGDCASSSVRHKRILSWRPRLARKPKWRIFTKPRGSTWSRKRRMNSVACSVMMDGGLAGVRIVLPAKAHVTILKRNQALVGDRHAMDITRQVLQDLVRSTKGWLGVNHPLALDNPV